MKTLNNICLAALMATAAWAETVHGTVTKVNADAKTVVIKTAEGTEWTLVAAGKAAVYGATEAGKQSWRGLKEGSEVVAHYTVKGTEKTATEFDKVGKDGLKATDGAVVRVDKGAKTVVVKTADGTEHAYHATDSALDALAKDTAKGADKTAKVTVHYTEEGGQKIAHFFEGR